MMSSSAVATEGPHPNNIPDQCSRWMVARRKGRTTTPGTTKQLHAASFDLEMLPWCKEHELAQVPSMTDPRCLCGSSLHPCHFNRLGAPDSEQCLGATARFVGPHHYCRQVVLSNTNELDLYGIKL